MTQYATETKVSAEKSRFEIERTVAKYGARQFLYRGEAIFGPHFDVDALHQIAIERRVDVREERAA